MLTSLFKLRTRARTEKYYFPIQTAHKIHIKISRRLILHKMSEVLYTRKFLQHRAIHANALKKNTHPVNSMVEVFF
eukprot:COSAG02_NODE_4142_length_5722_cov_21.915526_1_plen_76_part_00